jgi:tripeptidyl-peptidase-1
VKSTNGWRKVARAHPSTLIHLSIAIQQNNLDIVDQLFWDISNPKSGNYTKYLNLAQIGEIVSNPVGTRVVEKFLLDNGAQLVSKSNHGLFLDTVLPAQSVENIFNAEFNLYIDDQGKRSVKTEAFQIPSELQKHVVHLPHISHFPSHIKLGRRKPYVPKHKTTTPLPQVTPQLLLNYYGIENPQISENSGSTISLFEALNQDYDNADLEYFQRMFKVQIHDIDNVIGPNNASDCASSTGNVDCGEANLDVQYALSIAQGAESTYWSIPGDNIYIDWVKAVAAQENPPLVHSISYGGYEGEDEDMNLFNTEVKKLALRGITVIVSSGDDGVSNFQVRGNADKCGYNPAFPATSPFVTALGATQGPEESKPEVACSAKTGGAITTGGGFSNFFARPSYQESQVSQYLQQTTAYQGYNAQGRGIPDVSIMGRFYAVIIGKKTYHESGTSASAPVFAGMIALINDCRMQKGKTPLGFLNQALYSLDASIFTDVVEGENSCSADTENGPTCCQQGFSAASGWDPVTGLGTPQFPKLLNALCNL